MARGKKTADLLSQEEKLEQALVPEDQQPYKVPENWCWVYLMSGFAECLDYFRKPINSTERAVRAGNIPYYGATGQVGWIDNYLTDEQLVLVGEDGAPFLDLLKDKAYLIDGKAWVNNHAHILRSFYDKTGNIYLVNYLNSFNFAGFVNGTTRLKLTKASMSTIPIPLPPLPEQQRIVDRIESIFAKLDEAKEKAQAVVDGYELRKSAILHQAFTGELTKKWREEHGIGMDSWEKKRIGDILTIVKDKYDPTKDDPLDVPYIGLEHIEKGNGIIAVGNSNNVKSVKTVFRKGDVLYGKLRPYLDKHDISKFDGICSTDILVYRAENKETAKWFNYLIGTTSFIGYAMLNSSGINLPRTSEKAVSAFFVMVPQLMEQKKVVSLIDRIFDKEHQAKESAESVIEQINLMKKSVLARAFRGELGTNDPREESAVELLKRVL